MEDKDKDKDEKKDKEKDEEKGKSSFGKKLLVGLGVALGATAAAIGTKLAYDHFKNKKENNSVEDSTLENKINEENDSILRKAKTQKSLKTKVVDNTYDNNYIRINSFTEFDEKQKEKEFKCPITQQIMEEPVITPYGTSYEKSAIIDWIKKNKTDFETKKTLTEDMLVTNHILKVAIKDYKETLN